MGICTWIWQCSHSWALSGKIQSAKTAATLCALKSNESVRSAFFPELHHSSFRNPEAFARPPTSWLESRSVKDFDFFIVGFVMGPKRKQIESGKKLVFSVSEWQKCSRQFACHPEPFSRFCMRVRGSSWSVELRHDVLAQARFRTRPLLCDTKAY